MYEHFIDTLLKDRALNLQTTQSLLDSYTRRGYISPEERARITPDLLARLRERLRRG
jgi:hypothetical protein